MRVAQLPKDAEQEVQRDLLCDRDVLGLDCRLVAGDGKLSHRADGIVRLRGDTHGRSLPYRECRRRKMSAMTVSNATSAASGTTGTGALAACRSGLDPS